MLSPQMLTFILIYVVLWISLFMLMAFSASALSIKIYLLLLIGIGNGFFGAYSINCMVYGGCHALAWIYVVLAVLAMTFSIAKLYF